MDNRTCDVEGCNDPVKVESRGWCGKHYQRWVKWGDPLYVKQIYCDDDARFWSKVDKNGPVPLRRPDLGPCWLWTGPKTDAGYGRFTIKSQDVPAHRWIYEREVERIPSGMEPDHLCRNTSCVNYESHMEVVTRRENILRSDGPAAINARRTFCVNGHEFTPENTYIRPERRGGGRGGRTCRECRFEVQRRYREKKRAAKTATQPTGRPGKQPEGDPAASQWRTSPPRSRRSS